MRINFYGALRQIAGEKTVDIDISAGSTVNQLIDAVLASFPEMRDRLLDEEGQIGRHAHVIVNGRDAPHLENKLDTLLLTDDTVDVFPKGHF